MKKTSKLLIVALFLIIACFVSYRILKRSSKNEPSFVSVETLIPGKQGTKSLAEGDKVTLHYTNYLTNGTKLDSTQDTHAPFTFYFGKTQILKGWNQGLLGAKIGEKRRVITNYQYAYGEKGAPPKIPPKSDIVTEFEIVNIESQVSQ